MKENILRFLIDETLLTDVVAITADEAIPQDNIFAAYEGNVDIDGLTVTLQIILNKDFPLSKPRFYLKQPYALGFIPHVQSNGYVCYAHDEGLVLDLDNPTGIIAACLEKVIDTLVKGKTGANIKDFYEEFENYWAELKTGLDWISFVSITPFVKEIAVAYSEQLSKIVLGDTLNDITHGVKRFFGEGVTAKIFRWGIYIPLRAPIFPPHPDNFWSPKTLRKLIFSNVSRSNRERLKSILRKKKIKKDADEYILLSIPSSEEKRALAGVRFSKFSALSYKRCNSRKNFPHPLHKIGSAFEMTPHVIKRYDKDYILPRAGAISSLADKKVLLIGCGSVGGYIAFELTRAGIANLTLVDKDDLSPDNIHRHALGANRLYEFIEVNGIKTNKAIPKVEGLRAELEAKYPYVTVKTFRASIQELIQEQMLNIDAFDLIIIALGNPTVELFLNRYLHQVDKCPPAIFAWNEPLGIGGHALLTKNNGRSGCLECLYRDPDEPLYNKASFAAPGQFFGKTVAGCSNVFTPYGSMDSIQTAVLATRLGISVLLGHEKDNPLLSWKGDDRFFKQEYKLSPRYELSSEQLFDSRYYYKLKGCPICHHRGE
ncbi:E2/UBC family protein [Moorellaceae bacterium AZ2]